MSITQVSMRGRTCLVTGASGGLGLATARAMAGMGADLLLVARDPARGEAAAAQVRSAFPDTSVEVLLADLASLGAVHDLAGQVLARRRPLHVLVNNAGVAKFDRELSPEGYELTFATNHLGPFLLTQLLLELMKESAPSRIVNVSSEVHRQVRSLPWDDLQASRDFNGRRQYALTKLMNVMTTYRLAGRLAASGLTANCVSPGFVHTGLGRESKGWFRLFLALVRPFMASAEEGARTSVEVACSPELAGANGLYFRDRKPKESSTLSLDEAAGERLWRLSTELCADSPALAAPLAGRDKGEGWTRAT